MVAAVVLLPAAGVVGFAPPALAQGVTLQLPTYRTFRTTTTVSVPDRGGMFLGGVNRAGSSRQRFGSPLTHGGVGLGGSRQSAGVHVSAYIHDHQAMDQQLMGSARNDTATGDPAHANRFARRADPSLLSVAETRARQAAADKAQQAEAEACFQRGLDAAGIGKPGLAKIHFQMAARRAQGELKQRILAELDQLKRAVATIDR